MRRVLVPGESSEPSSLPSRGEEGIALILVLLLILLLSAIIVDYVYESQVEASLTTSNRDDFQAYIAAKSAVASGLALLQTDVIQGSIQGAAQQAGQLANQVNTALRTGQMSNTQIPQGQGQFDALTDMWAQPVTQPCNDATLTCTIDDEGGKINLNALFLKYDPNGGAPTENKPLIATLRALFKNMNLEGDSDPVDAILDWMSPEDAPPHERGAKSDAYTSSGYTCKNGPMDSIEELLLVAGITPQIYFDCNRGGDNTTAEQDGLRPASLPDLLTVHGDPKGKININTARREVIEALLTGMQTSGTGGGGDPVGTADTIIKTRLTSPFTQIPPEFAAQGTVKSSFYRIHGDGRANDVMVRIEAFVFRNYDPTGAYNMLLPNAGNNAAANNANTNTGTNNSSANNNVPATGQALESFRILDWKVIR